MTAIYTLLIVEDDADVRHSLSEEEQWLARGYRLVASAGSAAEALELCKHHSPDVVLSDIRMAEMSGLEMIKYLTEHGSEAVFVILSGYNRFQYAQTAVRLGVFEYLSKPVDGRKLDATFQRLRLHLDARKHNKLSSLEDERTQAVYREILLQGLLTQCIDEATVRERTEELNIHLPRGRMRVAAIWLRRLTLEQEALADQLTRFFTSEGYHVLLYKGCFVVFIHCGNAEEERLSLECLDRLATYVNMLPGCEQATLQIGLSSPVASVMLSAKAYNEAMKALNAHFYSSHELLRYEDLPVITDDPMLEATASQLSYIIADCIEKHDSIGASQSLDRLFDLFDNKRPVNVDRVFSICETLIGLLHARLEMLGIMRDAKERPLNCERFTRADTLPALRTEMRRRAGHALSRVRDHMGMRSNNVAWQVERYIDAHITKRFSVSDVAAAIHMNPDYLGRVFKKSTGDTLANYINARKVERAKEYLRLSSMSVQEIAMRLGYVEYRYFSEVFKKYVGSTPLKYRHSMLDDGAM